MIHYHPSPRPSLIAGFLFLCIGLHAQTAPVPAPNVTTEVIELSPFQVSTRKDRGYGANESLGATRVALPNSDVSSAVITLNEQVLSDRAATNAMEALTYVSGVQRDSDGQPGAEFFTLRGFSTQNINLRDGLSDPLNATDLPIGSDASTYGRLEVIKGPAGVLYGSHSMGGVVNRISKWPQFVASTKVELQAQSSDQFFRAVVDGTGPLNNDLAYRVTLASRRGERFYDEGDAPNDLDDVTFSLLRRIQKGQGKIWLRGEHLHFKLDRENGWQFITGFIDPLAPTVANTISKNGKFPVSVKANTVPEDDISIGEAYSTELGYEGRFAGPMSGDWTLRLVGRYANREGDKNPSYSQGRPVPVDSTGAIVRYINSSGVLTNGDNRFIAADNPLVADWRSTLVLRDFRGYNEAYNVNMDMTGDFETGPVRHKAVFSLGVGASESQRAFFFWNAANPANTSAVANSFSAVQKTPSDVNAASIKASGAVKQFNNLNGYSDGQGFSASALDNVSLFDDRVVASVGWRYDNAEGKTASFDSARSLTANDLIVNATTFATTKNSENTFRYGLVGKPVKGLSVFGQLSTTFTPVTGLNALTGEPLKNRDGKNKEVGLKTELWGNHLIGTISYFDSQLTNVLVPVVLPIEQGGGTFNLPVGAQNSFGWEADLAFEPIAGLNLLAAYSDVTSRDERGFAFRGVPIKPTYSLLSRYQFAPDSALKGAYVGASWKHRGTSPGDSARTFFVGGGDEYATFFGYARKKWSVQCNIENLTDSDAAWSSVTDQLVIRLQPRAYRLTFRYTF